MFDNNFIILANLRWIILNFAKDALQAKFVVTKIFKASIATKINISWQPPLEGWFKLNTYLACKGAFQFSRHWVCQQK